MEATIKQVQGITLVAKTKSNHWITLDGGEEFGGSKAAPGPMEMVLMALGGCTSMDVIPILKKMREPLQNLEVKVNAERAKEHPKVFTSVHIEYILTGDGLNPANIEKAINLSQDKYCSVSAMIKKSAPVTWSYRIVPASEK